MSARAPFSQTLETARHADATATLLARAAARAKKAWAHTDAENLEALAERYRDYAAALRETVTEDEPEPEADQGALL